MWKQKYLVSSFLRIAQSVRRVEYLVVGGDNSCRVHLEQGASRLDPRPKVTRLIFREAKLDLVPCRHCISLRTKYQEVQGPVTLN